MAKRREIVTRTNSEPVAKKKAVKKKTAVVKTPKTQKVYTKRRAINYDDTPFGILIGTSPVIQAAFKTEAEALSHISQLEIEKCFKASLAIIKPVKVETKITL